MSEPISTMDPLNMSPEERAAFGFDAAKVWTFTGREFSEIRPATKSLLPNSKINLTQRHRSVGVLACSFDRAYEIVKAKYPRLRIEAASVSNAAVDHIADDPRVLITLNKLGV